MFFFKKLQFIVYYSYLKLISLTPAPICMCVFACANQRLTLRFSIFILKQGLSLKQVIIDCLEQKPPNSRNIPTGPPPFHPPLFPLQQVCMAIQLFLFECWLSNSSPHACNASSSLIESSPLVEIVYLKAQIIGAGRHLVYGSFNSNSYKQNLQLMSR